MIFDDDIDLILGDSGYTLTIGSTTVPCEFSTGDQVAGQSSDYAGQVVGVTYALVRASAVSGLSTGAVLTITDSDSNATQYRAAQIQAIQDGRMTQILLGEADGSF